MVVHGLCMLWSVEMNEIHEVMVWKFMAVCLDHLCSKDELMLLDVLLVVVVNLMARIRV